jgi:RimJ/RimL family protein N-acetyltransferase
VQLTQPRHTRRLTLRRFSLDDLDDLSIIFENSEVNRYLYFEPRDRAETNKVLTARIAKPEDVEEDNVLSVAVELAASRRVIGDFMLRWLNDEHHQGEIGGSLNPNFHRQGYASEIYENLLDLGFSRYGLHRIIGRCDARNVASVRSLEKAGLHHEAHFVENEFVKGEWTDEVVLAIRREEWEGRRSLGD